MTAPTQMLRCLNPAASQVQSCPYLDALLGQDAVPTSCVHQLAQRPDPCSGLGPTGSPVGTKALIVRTLCSLS